MSYALSEVESVLKERKGDVLLDELLLMIHSEQTNQARAILISKIKYSQHIQIKHVHIEQVIRTYCRYV